MFKIICVFPSVILLAVSALSQSLRKSCTQPKRLSVRHPEKLGASGVCAVPTFLDVRFCFVIPSSCSRFGHLEMLSNSPGWFCTNFHKIVWIYCNSMTEFEGNNNEAQTVSGRHSIYRVSLRHIDCLGDSCRRIFSMNWRHSMYLKMCQIQRSCYLTTCSRWWLWSSQQEPPVRGNHFLPGHLCVGATDHGHCAEPWLYNSIHLQPPEAYPPWN